ncbi:MAG: hypothetical protein GY757_62400 [bacterium]|nr:hypothetical protein [bacterium]
MKYIVTILLVFATIAMGTGFCNSNDTLPIGPSKFKFKIDKIEKDQILQTTTGKIVTLGDIINQTKKTDVFIIGEAHNNYQCHTFQRDFVEALAKTLINKNSKNGNPPKLIVGFEFFKRKDNEALDQWRKGEISEEELLEKIEWYKNSNLNYGYTRLIMDVIKKYNIKVIGLNIPRSILRSVSRNGYDSLSAEKKKLFPTLNVPNPQHEYFIKNIFGTFAAQVPFWFTNIYTAQKCWDVIMAESMRNILAEKKYKGYKGIIIAGSNHVAYKLGIPFRYNKANKKARITTFVPILMDEKNEKDDDEMVHPMMKAMALNPAATFSRGIADYVFSAVQPEQEHFPTLGVVIKLKNERIVVTRVVKKGIADKHGIKKDNIIDSFDGIKLSSIQQLRLILSKKNWDDSIEVGLIKKVAIKKEGNTKKVVNKDTEKNIKKGIKKGMKKGMKK